MPECEISDERNFKAQLELSALRTSWAQLPTMERVERSRVLVDKGCSRRAIARGVGCSEGRVRQLLALENVTAAEKQALSEGSVSGKKALRKVQERKVRERLQGLMLSQEQRTKEIDRLVTVSLDWFGSLGLSKPYLEQLIYELGGGPYGIRRREFSRHAPELWQIPIGKDPEAVIKACRPKGDMQTMNGPDFLNYCFVWYARWSQRVMPDRKLRDRVLLLVEHRLVYAPASVSGS